MTIFPKPVPQSKPATPQPYKWVMPPQSGWGMLQGLRTWAGGRCLSASLPGIYRRGGGATQSGRRVQRGTSLN
jgi:hypothetical protein